MSLTKLIGLYPKLWPLTKTLRALSQSLWPLTKPRYARTVDLNSHVLEIYAFLMDVRAIRKFYELSAKYMCFPEMMLYVPCSRHCSIKQIEVLF